MNRAPLVSGLAFAMLLTAATSCSAQSPIDDIARSHIEANVPKGKLFDEYLRRDLRAYFCKDLKKCRVDYELLRQGPTQSGIAYPKYYLWVKVFIGEQISSDGAARVAAIAQKEFEVTDFLSSDEIRKFPSKVGTVFPAALVDKVLKKARARQ